MNLELVWDGMQTVPPGHTKGELLNPRACLGPSWLQYGAGWGELYTVNQARKARNMSRCPKAEAARRHLYLRRQREARRAER